MLAVAVHDPVVIDHWTVVPTEQLRRIEVHGGRGSSNRNIKLSNVLRNRLAELRRDPKPSRNSKVLPRDPSSRLGLVSGRTVTPETAMQLTREPMARPLDKEKEANCECARKCNTDQYNPAWIVY